MSDDRGSWWRLVGVAVLVALFLVPVAFMALMGLHAATWTMWDPSGDPPVWLMVLVVTVIAALLLIPGAVVGRVAGLRHGWLVVAALMAALGGVGTSALVVVTIGGEATPWGAVPGLVGGSLLAVVLADRLGGGGVDVSSGADRRGPVRSREDRVIAGVCGGWARAHGWEPARVRVLTVLAGVFATLAVRPLALVLLVLYVFAWLTWPLQPAESSTPPSAMV